MIECHVVTGCVLVAAASCTFSATAAFVKLSDLPLLPRTQGRFLVSWMLAVLVLKSFSGRCSIRTLGLQGAKGVRRLLLLRGVLYWGQVAMWWLAVQNLPLGDLTTAAQGAPILTSVLAWRFLNEPLSKYFSVVVIAALSGMSSLALAQNHRKAEFGSPQFKSGIAFIVAFAAMSVLPLLVRASRSAHWLEVEHVSAAVAALLLTPVALALHYFSDPSVYDTLLNSPYDLGLDAILLGIASFLALCMQTLGFQLAEASTASFMWYVQVPFSYFIQWCLFEELPSIYGVIGATCLVFAALLNLAGAQSAVKCVIAEDLAAELSGQSHEEPIC